MSSGKSGTNNERLDRVVLEAHKHRLERGQGYREKALKLYPWICGRCAREFTRANLQELTVHHRNHNHDDNPEDGSNWELLCLYCHDNEHQKQEEAARYGTGSTTQAATPSAKHNPFADLAARLKGESGKD